MRNFSADFRRVIGFLIVTAAFALPALAQDFTDTTKEAATDAEVTKAQTSDDALNAKNEFGVFGGFAPNIPRLFSGSRRSSYAKLICAIRAVWRRAKILPSNISSISCRSPFSIIPSSVCCKFRRPLFTTATIKPLTPSALHRRVFS